MTPRGKKILTESMLFIFFIIALSLAVWGVLSFENSHSTKDRRIQSVTILVPRNCKPLSVTRAGIPVVSFLCNERQKVIRSVYIPCLYIPQEINLKIKKNIKIPILETDKEVHYEK